MQGIGYRDCCDRWCVYFIIITILVLSRAIYVNLPSQELSICDSKPDQLVQIMYCRLFSVKPIPEPILATLGTHFREILLKIPIFSFLKMCFKMDAILSWPQCVKYIAYMLTLPSISCWRFRVFVPNDFDTNAVKLQACKIIVYPKK